MTETALFDISETAPPAEPVAVERSGHSSLMEQYREAKARHPDMLLLFRMGDFYETFDGDASVVHDLLGLTLTMRGDVPMAGFPHHCLESHLHKLLRAGKRVAICEQVEKAPPAAKVERVVVPERESLPDHGIARRLRKLAEGLVKQVEDKRRPMTQNATPKRMREYNSRVIDGDNLERGRLALLALADAWDRGDAPDILRSLRTKADLVPLVRHGIDHSGGYYSVVSTHKYADQSEAGKALQALLDASMTKQTAEEQAAAEKSRKIQAMVDRLWFCDVDGFFPTPEPVVRLMLERAGDLEGQSVLEPSAGIGSIAEMARERGASVECVERLHACCEILNAKGFVTECGDFLDRFPPEDIARQFDVVLMNPPFERMQDVDHVRHAWHFVKPGGWLVAIMSPSGFTGSTAKAADFQDWFSLNGFCWEDLPEKSFDGAGAFRRTGVRARLVWVQKGCE